MKKTIYTISVLLFSFYLHAQVGVNTENPQQLFHVDGKKDNPNSGAPNATQQINDVVITENGQIGVGTSSPTRKLEINNGATAGAIKIVDGTQGENKVLMSNAEGVGSWQTPASIRPTILGTFPNPARSFISTTALTHVNTAISIKLTKGKWVVSAGLTIDYKVANSHKWLHASLTSTSGHSVLINGFKHLGPAGGNTAFAGKMSTDLNFLSGSSVIEVTDNEVTLYLAIETIGHNEWAFTSAAYENYLYAIPIN